MHVLIFDLDGVLVDTVEGHYEGWKAVAERMGIPFTRYDNDQLRGVSRDTALKQILGKRYHYNDKASIELLQLKKDIYLAWVNKQGDLIRIPNTNKLLEKLKIYGYQIAIASASKNALLLLEKAQLTSLIDFVSDGYFKGQHKPAPAQIQSIMQKFCVTPNKCVVIEDSLAGVSAAKATHVRCIGIGNEDIKPFVDKYFDSLANVELDNFITACFPNINKQKANII